MLSAAPLLLQDWVGSMPRARGTAGVDVVRLLAVVTDHRTHGPKRRAGIYRSQPGFGEVLGARVPGCSASSAISLDPNRS